MANELEPIKEVVESIKRVTEMTPDEVAFQQQYREEPMFIIKEMGYPDEMAERYVYHTDLSIEFKIEKIFNQTPGPGAGKTIELAK